MTAGTRTLVVAALAAICLTLGGAGRASPLAYWNLDDGAGSTAANSVAGAPDGSLAANATWTTTTPPAIASTNAVELDHSATSYAEVTDLALLNQAFANPFTISLWARSDAAASAIPGDLGYMLDFGSAHGKGVGLMFNKSHPTFANGKISAYYNGKPLDSAQNGLADTWYHVALTHDGTDLTLYVDGAAVDSAPVALTTLTTSPTPTGTAGPFTIGNQAKSLTGRGWDGIVDDVAVWGSALGPTHIQELASGKSPLTAGPPSNGDTWVFENEGSSTQNPGPSKYDARWHYMEDFSAPTHAYTDISEFTDFDTYNSASSQWQTGGTATPACASRPAPCIRATARPPTARRSSPGRPTGRALPRWTTRSPAVPSAISSSTGTPAPTL